MIENELNVSPIKGLYQLAYYSKVLIRNKNKQCKGKDEQATTLTEISFVVLFKFYFSFKVNFVYASIANNKIYISQISGNVFLL